MAVYTIFVVTEEQSKRASKRWFGRRHFLEGGEGCYALQVHQDERGKKSKKDRKDEAIAAIVGKVIGCGHIVLWNDKLNAILVTVGKNGARLDEVGEGLVKQLGSEDWPHKWVVSETWQHFGA